MIKVLIADDQRLLRDCMKHMIESSGQIEVIGCADNGEDAVKLSKEQVPDLVLMDIIMPVCNGIEAVKKIKEFNNNIKIIMLTTSSNNEDIGIALKNGADGYVLKSISPEELILTIKGVYSGLDIIHKDVYVSVDSASEVQASVKVNDIYASLSERDIKIIALLVDGKSTTEIAKEMFLTEGRIRNIITDIIARLALKDRAQLVAFAFRNQLVK